MKYNKNCLEILGGIEDNSVQLVFSDPPYINPKKIKYGRSELGHRAIIGDDTDEWLQPFAKESFRVLKDKKWCVIFCQWRTMQKFIDAFTLEGFDLKTCAVWDKKNHSLGAGLAEAYEQILFFRKGKAKEKRFRSNVFRCSRVGGRPLHPHQKPIPLLKEIIELVSNEGDLIFDGFAGIGTISEAASQLNRKCISCELDEYYFNLIKDND